MTHTSTQYILYVAQCRMGMGQLCNPKIADMGCCMHELPNIVHMYIVHIHVLDDFHF